jgi:hypothetical protein
VGDASTDKNVPRAASTGVAEELERVMGIEPTLSAWKAEVLPLNYTRPTATDPVLQAMVEGEGFEPSVGVSQQIYSLPSLAT